MQQNFQLIRSLMPNQPAGGNPPAADGQPSDPNVPAATAGGGAQAGQGGPGGRGGRGGRGGGANGQNNRPRFDPAAMQKVMEQPEVKAKMEETRKEQSQLRDREYTMVFKALDRRRCLCSGRCWASRLTSTRSWVGSSVVVRGGGGTGLMATPTRRRPRPRPLPARHPAASAAPNATSGTKSATTPRPPSLRERRALGGQQPAPDSGSPN